MCSHIDVLGGGGRYCVPHILDDLHFINAV